MALWSRKPNPTPAPEPARTLDTRLDIEPEVVDADAVFEPGAPTGPPMTGVADMARVTASIIGHTGVWAAGAYLRAGRRVVAVVLDPTSAPGVVRDMTTEITRAVGALVEITDLDRRLIDAGPAGEMVRRVATAAAAALPGTEIELARGGVPARQDGHNTRSANLRSQGDDLLRRSRDVNYDYDAHPAYARILSDLAPDEARILRLMLIDGPQPTVDVRTGGPLGLINSRLIAPGLSMIGARAGCRYVDRVPSYLNNLFRLGLVWFSRETLRDHQRYQVLEAQPDVLGAIHSVTAAKVVRRSVHLTPFGEDFCRVCLSDGAGDLDELPEHSAPREADTAPQPPNETID